MSDTNYRLLIKPTREGYSVDSVSNFIRTQLAGGKGRYRRTILNGTQTVQVSWEVYQEGYDYLTRFYRSVTYEGSRGFKVELYLNNSTITEYTAWFIPDTFKLVGIVGELFTISAQLEVEPPEYSYEVESVYIAAAGLFDRFNFDIPLDIFDNLVNVEFPGDMP